LELGIGTGRLAIPLRATVAAVTGIDNSRKMLDRLASNDQLGTVTGVLGDMVDVLPTGQFDLVVAAYNTVFNLLTVERQQACFDRVAARLADDGTFVVEAFVPQPHTGSQVSVRSLTADRLVLSASVHSAADQVADGQFVEMTEAGGIRLRPWSIRWAEPEQLDAMAVHSGLALRQRWADYDRSAFDSTSERHVSVYGRSDRTATAT
jgi:SAM-dependent methyltransferase